MNTFRRYFLSTTSIALLALMMALAPCRAATVKGAFGTNGQAITVSLAPGGVGLANNGARASTVVDNTTNLYLDALVFIGYKTGASGTAATGTATIYAYATANGGTNYTEGATGTDAALTLVSPTNLRVIGSLNCVANATTYYAGPFSVAQAFGGTLPDHWGIVILNQCGGAADTTEANHLKVYQGVYATSN